MFTITIICSLLMGTAFAETIRETPLGLKKDGEIIRSNPLGHYETEEGTYRKDAMGMYTDDNGTVIRKTPLGWEKQHAEDDSER